MPSHGQVLRRKLGDLFSEAAKLSKLLFGQAEDAIEVPVLVVDFQVIRVIENRKFIVIRNIFRPSALIQVGSVVLRRELI